MTARRPILRVTLLIVALLAGSVVAGCSSSTSSSAPSLKDVAALLVRHGAAVLAHDRKAFLADIDPAGKAAAFRQQQTTAFDNLIKVPLASWSYTIQSRTDDHEAEIAAGKAYGASALIVHLSLRYALRGVDRVPTSHDVWWTFVRYDGRVVAAADNGLADAGGVSWKGPWDFGTLTVVRTARGLVLGHADSAVPLSTIAAVVDSAVPAVSAVWGDNWSRDVAVIVPSSAAELSAEVGESSQLTTQIAAVAISDGQDPVTGAVLGQRLIVNPAAFGKLSAIVVRHEITHIASAPATTDASPRWLVEGFADYVGNLGSGQSVKTTASELRADVERGKLSRTLPTEAAFDTDGEAAQAYEGAWLACRLIAQRIGPAGLVRFYRAVGASPDDPDGAVAATLRAMLRESTAQFTAQWRAYVTEQLG
jgi:hypothetical protein